MTLRSRIPALAIILAFLLPAAALAQTVTLQQGQTLNVQMQDNIDSGSAYAGQHFTARVVSPYPNDDNTFANAVVHGTVIKVVPAGQGRNPELHFSWDSVTLQNGASYPINAEMTNGGPSSENRNGGHVALTTIGGMILGNIVGKTIFHTNAGGAIGAAGGFLTGYNKKSNIVLKQGTTVGLTLTRPLMVRRQAGNPYQ
ncbi:MAG TPA: hypothetical protein VKT72_06500 [Candidatus Baltobacteraceae bacterium]|nr:hypothetical protein [Candidatus Baltobacteraceae bacterium]